MNDQELADRVVALGVGRCDDGIYWIPPVSSTSAEYFVRDGRVAMALMERCRLHAITIDTENAAECVSVQTQRGMQFSGALGDSLPRAIVEACVQALESGQ